ncbi:hypothetical protein [Streptomyces griseosporeus]|uniref:hypothetical protein n=1 Tax=Streptomyces griseosporeus TaxID=1910 RepID=UPI0036F80DAC
MPQGIEAPASSTAEGQTSHTQNQSAGLAKLREAFPADQIQALPKLWCKRCSDSRTKVCEDHRKAQCKECGNYITTAHVDLNYVGHAELTNRLLDADPLWTWEPLALDQRGLPQLDEHGGLWIRLTVCGHTRLGYGDSQGKKGPNAVKEAIGDALRNAAMRFGAALDLWAKSDLKAAQAEHPQSEEDEGRTSAPSSAQATPRAGTSTASGGQPVDHLGRLRKQALECWDNSLALAQIVLDAEKHKVADQEVPLKTGGSATLRELLNARITELDQAAQGGTTERSAA